MTGPETNQPDLSFPRAAPGSTPAAASAIIILPYTSRIEGIAGTQIIQGRTARIRLSSFSAMVTVAAALLYHDRVGHHVVALGEHTFGPTHPSTADLMRAFLLQRGVPLQAITALGNLQDTNVQLQALTTLDPVLIRQPLYVAMGFHRRRVQLILAAQSLPGRVIVAEEVLLERARRRSAALHAHDGRRYHAVLARHARKLRHFTPLRVRLAERVFRAATHLGPLNALLLHALRGLRGGPTVTDYHTLTSAAKHLEAAADAIAHGRLGAAQRAADGITREEAMQVLQGRSRQRPK